MKPILSADGEEISWLNYKTGIKHLYFKMEVDSKYADIAILITHPDPGIRQSFFDKFMHLRDILNEALEESDWIWTPDATDEYGKPQSVIHKSLHGVNIFRMEDWPAVISFFKPRIIALDAFWSVAKYQFYD